MISVDEIALEQGLEPEDIIEFLHDFVAYTNGEELPALREAVTAGDFAGIKQRAHSIKGAALNLKLDQIASFARSIEEKGASGTVDEVDSLMSELGEAVQELETWLADLPKT